MVLTNAPVSWSLFFFFLKLKEEHEKLQNNTFFDRTQRRFNPKIRTRKEKNLFRKLKHDLSHVLRASGE